MTSPMQQPLSLEDERYTEIELAWDTWASKRKFISAFGAFRAALAFGKGYACVHGNDVLTCPACKAEPPPIPAKKASTRPASCPTCDFQTNDLCSNSWHLDSSPNGKGES